jgi:hypothetical protein
MMRRILLDAARARATGKRGGGELRITLHEDLLASNQAAGLIGIDDALQASCRVLGINGAENRVKVTRVSPLGQSHQ